MPREYLIIGNSTAGHFAVEDIRKHDPEGNITLVSREPHLAYSKVLLTHYIVGVDREQLFLANDIYYHKKQVNLLLGKSAINLNADKQKIELEGGEKLTYDLLLLATGSRPYYPKYIPSNVEGIIGLRTIEEAEYLKKKAKAGDKIVILGGGLVGVTLASALKKIRVIPELLVSSPHLLSQIADDESAAMIKNRMTGSGIKIRTCVKVENVIVEKSKIKGVILDDGSFINCDVLVVCKGICPNVELLKDQFYGSGGLRVDRKMRTHISNVYAAGDVAETFDIVRRCFSITGSWVHAALQGRIAGSNMAGCENLYRGSLSRNVLNVLGLPFISIGVFNAPSNGDWEVECNRKGDCYSKHIYRNGLLAGAVLVGKVDSAGLLQAEIRRNHAHL